LGQLWLDRTGVGDAGMDLLRHWKNLTTLSLTGTRVGDAGLANCKHCPGLWRVYLEGTRVSDLSPLKGMKLAVLRVRGARVKDLSPLKGMPLEEISCDTKAGRDANFLRSLDTLETINDKPATEFWKESRRRRHSGREGPGGEDLGEVPEVSVVPSERASSLTYTSPGRRRGRWSNSGGSGRLWVSTWWALVYQAMGANPKRPLPTLAEGVIALVPPTAPAVASPTAPATPVAASSSASAPILLGPGLVDGQAPPADLLAAEGGDGGLGLLVGAHLDEPEALGAARVPVQDDLGGPDGAVRLLERGGRRSAPGPAGGSYRPAPNPDRARCRGWSNAGSSRRPRRKWRGLPGRYLFSAWDASPTQTFIEGCEGLDSSAIAETTRSLARKRLASEAPLLGEARVRGRAQEAEVPEAPGQVEHLLGIGEIRDPTERRLDLLLVGNRVEANLTARERCLAQRVIRLTRLVRLR
jgi:hypothetical protein